MSAKEMAGPDDGNEVIVKGAWSRPEEESEKKWDVLGCCRCGWVKLGRRSGEEKQR